MHDRLGLSVLRFLHDAPRDVVLQAVVGLPRERLGLRKAASFHIQNADPQGKVRLLVGQHALRAELVVAFGHGVTLLLGDDAGAAVKIQGVRPVGFAHLEHLVFPQLVELRVRIAVGQIAVGFQRQGFSVVFLVGGIVNVRLVIGGHKPAPVPGVVEGGQHLDAPLAERLGGQPRNIPPGAVIDAVVPGNLAVPHGKVIGVLGYQPRIPRARANDKLRPLVRVKPRAGERLVKILIPELRKPAVCFDMVIALGQALGVHVARVPLVLIGGNAVRPPVKKQAELRVPKPGGRFVLHVRPMNRLIRRHFRSSLRFIVAGCGYARGRAASGLRRAPPPL